MISKAVIPVAGKATRLMPVSKAIPKALFPLVDLRGKIHTVLDVICREAVSAGAGNIGIVVSARQSGLIKTYLKDAPQTLLQYERPDIEFITQQKPRGFGDAVLRARDFAAGEPFILFLGDHIQIPGKDAPACGLQLARAFDSMDALALAGVQTVSRKELSRVGAAAGVPAGQNIYRCTRFIEKPDPDTACRKLKTPGLEDDNFLAHCGIYIFSPEIFDCLQEIKEKNIGRDEELELTDAQSLLLKKYPEKYFLYKINGLAYDMGTPDGYVRTQEAFRNSGQIRKP